MREPLSFWLRLIKGQLSIINKEGKIKGPEAIAEAMKRARKNYNKLAK